MNNTDSDNFTEEGDFSTTTLLVTTVVWEPGTTNQDTTVTK